MSALEVVESLRQTHRSVLLLLYVLAALPNGRATLLGLCQAMGHRSVRSVRRVVVQGVEMGLIRHGYRKSGVKVIALTPRALVMLHHFFERGTRRVLPN